MNRSAMFGSIWLATVVGCLTIGFYWGRANGSPSADSRPLASGSDHDKSPGTRSPETVSGSGASTRPADPQTADRATGASSESTTGTPSSRPDAASAANSIDPADENDSEAPPLEPDPERAADLVASIKEAIASGDTTTLDALATEIPIQAQFLTPDLAVMLGTADSLFAKEQLARLLGLTGDARSLGAIEALLENETNGEVRTAAVTALGDIGDPSSIPLLNAEFKRKADSPMPSSLAASSLGKIGTTAAIEALKTETRQGTDRMTRAFAIQALSKLGDPTLVPFFFEQAARTEGMSERSRKATINAIALTGDRTAIPQLDAIVGDETYPESVREAAKRAVNQLSGEAVYPIL